MYCPGLFTNTPTIRPNVPLCLRSISNLSLLELVKAISIPEKNADSNNDTIATTITDTITQKLSQNSILRNHTNSPYDLNSLTFIMEIRYTDGF